MNANRLIAIALGILTAGVLVLGWFLGVSPKLAEATQADGERTLVEVQNSAHQAVLAELAGKFENIDELRADLKELHAFIPDTHRLEDFLDSMNAKAAAAGVVITVVNVGEPQLPIVDAAAATPAPGPALVDIPVTVQVTGELGAVLAFADAAQNADRVFVVTNFGWEPTAGGILTGSLYVIAEPTVEPAS